VTKGVWGQRIHTAKEDAEVALVKYGGAKSFSLDSELAGKVEADCNGLVVRRAAGKQDVLVGGWDVLSYAGKGLEFTTDGPAELLIRLHEGHAALMNAGDRPTQVQVNRPFAGKITLAAAGAVELDSKGAQPVSDNQLFVMPAE